TQAGTESTTVVHEIVETHESGFTGSITVTNTSQNPLEAWELVLAFDNAEIVEVEGADWEPIEDGVLVRRPDGRTGPAPGDSMSCTFHALGNPESPRRCLLTGQDCNLWPGDATAVSVSTCGPQSPRSAGRDPGRKRRSAFRPRSEGASRNRRLKRPGGPPC